tara:strand:- start:622 stop:867 length:246 start_codon:yes stop_codon:yes gene_type:complete
MWQAALFCAGGPHSNNRSVSPEPRGAALFDNVVGSNQIHLGTIDKLFASMLKIYRDPVTDHRLDLPNSPVRFICEHNKAAG